MLQSLFRHVLYILINIIILAILLQAGIMVSRVAFDFGRSFMAEFIEEEPEEELEEAEETQIF